MTEERVRIEALSEKSAAMREVLGELGNTPGQCVSGKSEVFWEKAWEWVREAEAQLGEVGEEGLADTGEVHEGERCACGVEGRERRWGRMGKLARLS